MLSRRQLLARLILAGAAISRLPTIAAAGRSRVVIPHETSVFEGEKIAAPVLQSMLDRSVAKMVGTSRAADAWKQLFSASDVVGIKTNSGFGPGASTHVELVQAIIQGLRSAGVSEGNIIVWDHTTSALIRGGLRPNRTGPGVRYYGCDKEWGPVVRQGVFDGRICKVLSEMATAVVNVPALKKHHRCGISCALKNHFGSIEEPEKLHDVRGPYVDPGIADVSAIPAVLELSHLPIIADPSHGTGRYQLVPPVAKAAVAAGADGLMIEVHPNPAKALKDGAQSLTPANFATMMTETAAVARAVGRYL